MLIEKNLFFINTSENGSKKSILLHSCCAPCSSYVISYLADFFEITVFYYNPNITDRNEYIKRKDEQIRLISLINIKHPVDFIDGDYDSALFFTKIKGHEKDCEGGERCRLCFEMRINKTAETAKKLNFDLFTTTLTVSPHKNAKMINEIGGQAEKEYQTEYLYSDFKKKDGYKKSIELSKKYNLYRQNFCGCIFSNFEK